MVRTCEHSVALRYVFLMVRLDII